MINKLAGLLGMREGDDYDAGYNAVTPEERARRHRESKINFDRLERAIAAATAKGDQTLVSELMNMKAMAKENPEEFLQDYPMYKMEAAEDGEEKAEVKIGMAIRDLANDAKRKLNPEGDTNMRLAIKALEEIREQAEFLLDLHSRVGENESDSSQSELRNPPQIEDFGKSLVVTNPPEWVDPYELLNYATNVEKEGPETYRFDGVHKETKAELKKILMGKRVGGDDFTGS